MTIVKVQRAVFSTDPNVGCLVYDQQRKHMVEQPVTQNVIDQLAGDYKGYFNATWTTKPTTGKTWRIAERVEDQAW